MDREKELRGKVLEAAREYYEFRHGTKEKFTTGKRIPYAGRVFDDKEVCNLVESGLDFWLTAGRFAEKFEREFASFLGTRHCSLTNSGSSANLLAFMALTSPKLGERRIKKGDEVITVAAGFPTTVAPIVQYGAVPVFVDVAIPQYNIDCDQLKDALSKRTKAVFLAHTLGNPFDLASVREFCDKNGLWLVEDNCDSLGSKYFIDGEWKYTGTVGHLGTSSFYPPHHMSCSQDTPIPYINDDGKWKLEPIEKIYELYANVPGKIRVISFDKNNKVGWAVPSAILRHKVGSKKMVKITCQHGREVKVTEDHSVFILDKATAEIIPMPAGKIKTDDYIIATNNIPDPKIIKRIDLIPHFRNKNAYVSNFSLANLKAVNNSDYRWQFKARNSLPIKYLGKYNPKSNNLKIGISQSNKIPVTIKVNRDLCRLVGYFLAEGSYQDGLVFSFHKNEVDLIRDVKFISESLFNLPISLTRVGKNAVNVEINSKNLEVAFREVFEIRGGASKKRIPWFIYHTNETCINSFIYGYTKGDGSIRKRKDNTNYIDVTSVSRVLLNDFQYLLSRVGISASFYRRNTTKSKKIGKIWTTANENYSLAFSGYVYKNRSIVKVNTKDRNNLSLQIPLLDIFRKYICVGKGQEIIARSRLKKHLKKSSKLYKLVTSPLSFLKVRSIEQYNCDKNEYVYDISVPGKENFYGSFLGLFMHNTMGEGGAVYTNDSSLKKLVESFRDWGRDCFCPPGKDDTCGKRFERSFGGLPLGYDHKYVYSHFGYNLKVTDMQAAVGCAQLDKLQSFIEARKKNWAALREGLSCLSGKLILPEPTKNSDPSWFGFLMTVRDDAGFNREQIVSYLEKNNIQTRVLFAGNLIKHPCFDEMRKEGKGYRVVGELTNTDRIMSDTFWIGVYPGMNQKMLAYMCETLTEFMFQ